jgi:hypothetical protein
MDEVSQFCKSLKKDFTPKVQNAKKPVRWWSEKDVFDGQIDDAYVIIFRTKGCSWALQSGCTMCGYFNDSMWQSVSDKDLLTQFDTALNRYHGEKVIKIFTSGSFLDDNEVKPAVRKQILGKLAETADKISVESRPEYITDKMLTDVKTVVDSKVFEIGIGLETADDYIRQHAINKGFTFNDYKKAVALIKNHDCQVKTYVLVKPPFLTENCAIEDSIDTVKNIKAYTDTVSFNPVNVQRGTLVEYLWKRREYRPAWLWSVVEILKKSKEIAGNKLVKCDVVGGGSKRGVHNCGTCDKQFLDAIAQFSLTQDMDVFDHLECGCKERWLDQLDLEPLGFGSLVDLSGVMQ